MTRSTDVAAEKNQISGDSSKRAKPLEPFQTFPPLSPSTPFPPYPYYIPPQVQASPLFSAFISSAFLQPFLCPLVVLYLVVSVQPDPTPHRQQPGWYPALYSPVHCNSATMSTRSMLDGWDRITPSALSGTCQTEGRRGSHCQRFSYLGGLYHVLHGEIRAIGE